MVIQRSLSDKEIADGVMAVLQSWEIQDSPVNEYHERCITNLRQEQAYNLFMKFFKIIMGGSND